MMRFFLYYPFAKPKQQTKFVAEVNIVPTGNKCATDHKSND